MKFNPYSFEERECSFWEINFKGKRSGWDKNSK